jgi:hypothetical protein
MDRAEGPTDPPGAQRLDGEERNKDHYGGRQDVRSEGRRDDVEPFERRNRRRNCAVAIDQRSPEHREIACRACGAPLPAREGKYVLKYFLLRKAGRREVCAGLTLPVDPQIGRPPAPECWGVVGQKTQFSRLASRLAIRENGPPPGERERTEGALAGAVLPAAGEGQPGNNTVLITWMTPFDCMTSPIVVRLQMVWDNLSCLGTEALARLD